MHQILRKALVLSLAAAVVVGVVAAVAFAGPGNSPAITFASPSPVDGATLTSNSATFAFAYNRTTKQTRSLVCSLSGPSTSLSAPCDHLVNIKDGAQADKLYTGLANGSYTFTAKLTLTDGGTTSATRHFTVAVNRAPVAGNDAYTTNEDTPLTVTAPGVLGNDSDADGNPLTAVLVIGPSHGSLLLNANGSFTYSPSANYNGSDSFSYKASDGSLPSNLATVSITVNPVNDAPIANDDSFTTDEDTPLTIPTSQLLANDSDVDGDPLTVFSVQSGVLGTVSQLPGDQISFTPDANVNGLATFTYSIIDGRGGIANATVKVTVNPVDDAPVAVNDSVSTYEDTPLTVTAPGVLGNDSDIDSPTLSAVLVTSPSNGSLTLNSDGSFSYTPAAGYSGPDSFSYKANDGSADSNVATVNVTVNPSLTLSGAKLTDQNRRRPIQLRLRERPRRLADVHGYQPRQRSN